MLSIRRNLKKLQLIRKFRNLALGVERATASLKFMSERAATLIHSASYRYYKLEAEIASMTWKVRSEELLPVRTGDGKNAALGSRFSLPRGVS